MWFNIPKDKVASVESIAITTNKITLAFVLEIFNLSTSDAIGTSKILMPEVRAANKINIKNAVETIYLIVAI